MIAKIKAAVPKMYGKNKSETQERIMDTMESAALGEPVPCADTVLVDIVC
jgi:hypothetical protein